MAQGKKTILTDEQKAEIKLLASHFCTKTEIIARMNLGINLDTFTDNFTKIYENGREYGKSILRSLQNKAAQNGNVTMLIWLGKQYLGQSDKTEITDNKEIVIKDQSE